MNKDAHSDESFYEPLARRFGETFMRQRLMLQVKHATSLFGHGRTLFHIENVGWITIIIHYLLKITGLYGLGYRSFLNVQIIENEVWLADLPPEFDGYRVLQLSDLHIDLDPALALTDRIIDLLKDLSYDLCLITGDYRAHTGGAYELSLSETARITNHIPTPIYGILGNHDFIEFVPYLEKDAGISLLINESIAIERNGERIYLVGIDDPHLYQTEDFAAALQDVPKDHIKILLSHSPETYREAEDLEFDFMLAGHTHAGQFCLPGGIPILTHGRCPRYMVYGPWKYGSLIGYTTSGTGSGEVPARFFCLPEMVIHILRRKT